MALKINRNQYRRDYLIRHGSYERKVYPYFKNALDKAVKAIVDHVKQNGIVLLEPMIPMLINPELMRSAYLNAYEDIGLMEAEYVEGHLYEMIEDKAVKSVRKDDINFRSEFYRNLIRDFYLYEAGTLIAEVDMTTIERIRAILSEAAIQNLTLLQQSEYLIERLSNPNYNKNRALVIARTETTRISNRAANMAGENAPFYTDKGWIYVNDHRVRTGHRAVGDAGNVPINAYFEVPRPDGLGVDLMRHPGDINAPANQTISCRCTQVIIPRVDENGVPVMKL